jgi:MFS family permease
MTTDVQVEVPPFRQDRLARSWLGLKAISDAGDALWTIALAWTAVQIASPAAAGAVVAAGAIPRAITLLVGGALADRYDAVRVMTIANLARIGVLVGVGVWVMVASPTVVVLVVAAVAFGLSDAVYEPAAGTLGRQLVRPTDLAAYGGLGQTLTRIGVMVGSATGGVVVAAWGLGGSAALNAVTFGVVVLFLVVKLRLRFPLPRSEPESVLRSVRGGFAYLRSARTARTLAVSLMGLNLFVGPALGIGLAIRAVQDDWGAGRLGICISLVGLGAAAGSLSLVRWKPRLEAAAGFGWLVVQGIAIALLGVGPIWLTAVACLLIGVTAGIASTLLGAVAQVTIDGAFLGRTMALMRLGDDVFMPGAMALFGLLASATSVSTAFVVYGVGMAVVLLRPLADRSIRGLTTVSDVPG